MVRYALRAFPAICPKSGGRPFDEQFFLRHARSLIAACCFLADRSEETHAAAAFAAFAAGDFTRNKLQTAASIAAEAASKSLVLGDEGEARDTILNAIELLPLTDFFEQSKWDLEQLQRKPVRSPISPSPLWTVPLLHFSADQKIPLPNDHELKSRLSFWLEWYQGFLDGKLVDWELQRRVALIDDAIWDAGPEAVAAEIERIRGRYELEQEVARLKEQLATVERTPTAALIGDNGGPPLEDAAARALETDLALIWKQVEELEEEIAKPSPSPSLLEKIAKALWEISLRMAAYCGSVADGMIREGSKELAKAGAKWTARATAVTITAQTEDVQSVAKAIWAFVNALQ